MEKKSGGTHTVMPKKLAEALMEAGMQHFDVGGQAQPGNQATTGNSGFQTNGPGISGDSVGSMFLTGNPTAGDAAHPQNPQQYLNQGQNSFGQAVNGAGGMLQDAAGAFTAQNQFQANAPDIARQNFAPQIGQLQRQAGQTYFQQQDLAKQLLAQSQGQGPNPAQAQLAQNTGNNVQTQGALMASQRGANSNPALMARQAAQQGAGTQQAAVGQAATLQAQQQIAAQQGAASLYGNMANQSLQGESIQQGGQAAQNTAITSGELGSQQINANISGQNAAALNGTAGGISNALGAGLANALAKGGYVQKFDSGGIANYAAPGIPDIHLTDWKNQGIQYSPSAGKAKPKSPDQGAPQDSGPATAQEQTKQYPGGGQYAMPMNYDEGGDIQPLMGIQDYTQKSSPGTSAGNVPNAGVSAAKSGGGGGGGGMLGGLMALLAHGGPVPTSMLAGGPVGGKAKVKGDSPKNDTVPAMVSPGEVVLPRSVTQGGNVEAKAVAFLRHLKGSKSGGYKSVIESRKSRGGRC